MPPNVYRYRYSTFLPDIVSKPASAAKSTTKKPKQAKRLPTPNALRPRNDNLPTSLESAHRKAMMILHMVEKDRSKFQQNHFKDARNTFGFETDDLINYVYERNGKVPRAKDIHEFVTYLDKCRTTASLLYKPEIEKIDVIARRSSAFDSFMDRAENDLQIAFKDYVDKYCLSFVAEMDDLDIKCVRDYENNIVKWRDSVTEDLNDLKSAKNRLSQLRGGTFTEFMSHYDDILHTMKSALKIFPMVTETLKNWITADESYQWKIHTEINSLAKEKIQRVADEREQELRASYSQHNIKRADYNTMLLQRKLQIAMDRKKHTRKSEVSLKERKAFTEESIEKADKEEQRLYEVYYLKFDNNLESQRTMNKILSIQSEQRKLKKEVDRIASKLDAISAQRKEIQKDIHKLQRQCERKAKGDKNIQLNANMEEKRAKMNHEMNSELKKKIVCLKKIHAIKIHPETIRKINNEGYRLGKKMDITDSFSEACKITAANIGGRWPELYLELPFVPSRDLHIRRQDIEAFDIAGQKRDLMYRDIALRSLAKWKRHSSEATVNSLLFALKCIGKGRIAHKIEKHLSTSE